MHTSWLDREENGRYCDNVDSLTSRSDSEFVSLDSAVCPAFFSGWHFSLFLPVLTAVCCLCSKFVFFKDFILEKGLEVQPSGEICHWGGL